MAEVIVVQKTRVRARAARLMWLVLPMLFFFVSRNTRWCLSTRPKYEPTVQATIHEAHGGIQGCCRKSQLRTIQDDRALHRWDEPGSRIAGIRVPTLVIHAQDDTLQPYRNAEFFSSTIPDSRLLSFQKGGHIVSLIEVDEVGSTVQKHIIANACELCVQVPAPESAGVLEEL